MWAETKSSPPLTSNVSSDLNGLCDVTVYYHQLQLLGVAESDYIFNTFSAFFNMLKQSLERNRLHYMLRGRVNLAEWEYEHKKVKSRKAHVLVNYKLGVMMYRYSLSPEAPVMIRFLTSNFTLASDNPSVENNVVIISKNYETNKTIIDIHYVGSFRRLEEFLDVLSTLTHRNIDFSIIDFRPVRVELFVRYDYTKEQQVARMLGALYRRFGYDDMDWKQKSSNNNDVQYLKRVHIIFDNMKMHVKSYRRKNYRDPPRDYYDHPKLEISVYFSENDTLEDAKRKTEIAAEFLASLVYVSGIGDYLIYNDTFEKMSSPINENIVELLSQATLELDELYSYLIKDELDRYLLELLSQENVKSEMLPALAELFSVSVRTVQRRLKKFEDAGIIEKRKVNNNRYVYVVKPLLAEPTRDIGKIKEIVDSSLILDIKLTEKDYLIISFIAQGYTTSAQLSRIMKLSKRTVQYHLNKLMSAALLTSRKVGRTYRYELNNNLRELLSM